MTHPTITATTHPLPFPQLSPRDFERLCPWMVEEILSASERIGENRAVLWMSDN